MFNRLEANSRDMFRCMKRDMDSRESSHVTHLQFKREPNLSYPGSSARCE